MLKKATALRLSDGSVGGLGFTLGVYLLPIITAPAGPAAYNTVIFGCETSGQFISAATYR